MTVYRIWCSERYLREVLFSASGVFSPREERQGPDDSEQHRLFKLSLFIYSTERRNEDGYRGEFADPSGDPSSSSVHSVSRSVVEEL